VIVLTLACVLCFVGCSNKSSSEKEFEVQQAAYSQSASSATETLETAEATETSLPMPTLNTSDKICINENVELTKDAAEGLVVRLLKEYYTTIEPVAISPDSYIVDCDSTIRNERVKEHLAEYVSNSSSTVYYQAMSEYGTFYSVIGLTEKEIVLFEMDNNRFAISEPYSDIADYSMRYPYLFCMRNSDSTTAYYWCAQQETDLISYASHRVVRIWLYNTEWNTYSCIYEKE